MKRYDPEPDHYGGCDMCSAKMIECADGDYVLFDDVERSAMCEANAQPQLYDVPSNPEVYQWLKDMKYQTDDGAQEYIMYFDMPKILDDYFKWRVNRHVI